MSSGTSANTGKIYIPSNHPRAVSLHTRELLVEGFRKGLVAAEGLIAHGRGEAYDYLIGERTTETASKAITAASASLLLAKHPVISVNGNIAALCPKEIVDLAKACNASIEVNLFYRTTEREKAVEQHLLKNGASRVLGVGERASAKIPELQSERRRVDPEGILVADVVLVPLEDGDRTEALVKMGKKVITIDLNPLSRTAKMADVTIVDNVVRAFPAMIEKARELKDSSEEEKKKIVQRFDNQKNLLDSIKIIRQGVP